MTPEQIAAPGTEHSHQAALFCWMAQHFHIWPELKWAFAIPNGGERNIIVASKLRAEGVKAGVSDICIPVRRLYAGFYLEMKKPGGKESKEQKQFGEFVVSQGYLYKCADHWAIAADYIARYMDSDMSLIDA
jgi:hypothetical protein